MGKLIVFEGIDGSGKTTQVNLLKKKIEKAGKSVIIECEPSRGQIGELIRAALTGMSKFSEETLAMLFAADRIEHIAGVLLPALQKVDFVICDRYYFSNFAYQGLNVPLERVYELNVKAVATLPANLTIFLDTLPKVCFGRVAKRGGKREIFENSDTAERLRASYLEAFEKYGDNESIVTINGDADIEKVGEEIWNVVCENLKL